MLVTFIHNEAIQGGVIYSWFNLNITFEGNSSVRFIENKAKENGGVIYSFTNTSITFNDFAIIMFENNNALIGGAVYSNDNTFTTVT